MRISKLYTEFNIRYHFQFPYNNILMLEQNNIEDKTGGQGGQSHHEDNNLCIQTGIQIYERSSFFNFQDHSQGMESKMKGFLFHHYVNVCTNTCRM